jgi:hypothetical protein
MKKGKRSKKNKSTKARVPEQRTDAKGGQRKYQVFISSTFRDLAAQRRVVVDEVVARGHMPIALERFPAEDSSVPLVIQRTIKASQIYIVILGYRYGAVVKGRDISFSQLEYELAHGSGIVVVPFLLVDAEVNTHRDELRDGLEEKKIQVQRFAANSQDRKKLEKEIADLEVELGNEDKLWKFRSEVQSGRFFKLFSLNEGGNESSGLVDQFAKHMVLEALLVAEEKAVEKRIPGWIREPADAKLAETIEAVAQNRFLPGVISAMKFEKLRPRVRDHAEEKEAAASFFVDKYLPHLVDKNIGLFFESGSTVAFVAEAVGKNLKDHPAKLQISTNNVLAYMIFWLVHRIRCSLFPWGPPEQQYGAVFGPINDYVVESKKPGFPPDPLNEGDKKAIKILEDNPFSPGKWECGTLMLGALSGFQFAKDASIANCLGPHVGSPRNKVFKRFMYATKLPVMLFMTSDKINSPVDRERCHFILDQQPDGELPWESFCSEWPVGFCVGCKNDPERIEQAVEKFRSLGLEIIRPKHLTPYTAFIARNRPFIDRLEVGMNLR